MKTKLQVLKTVTSGVLMISLLTGGTFLFQHCQKIDADYTLDVPEEYVEVGKTHNEGLDYIFAEIQAKCIEFAKKNEADPINSKSLDYLSIGQDALIEFCRTNPATKGNTGLYEAFVLHSGTTYKSSRAIEMNPKQQELLSDLQLALKTEFNSKNLKQLKARLNSINNRAMSELSENDAAEIFCATSTAYSTFQYWNKNYRAWYFALNYPEILEQFKKADLNNLSLKSTISLSDTIPSGTDWIKKVWDRVEGWYFNTADAIDIWWDIYGDGIMISDCVGAAFGAGDAIVAAGASSLVFGPEGTVVVGVGGAIVGGIDASAKAITVSGTMEILKN